MRRPFDPRLYLVTDARLPDGELFARVAAAATAGVTLVQLRDKAADTDRRTDLARRLISIVAPHAIPLIVNDDVEAAVASGAAGVHLGQSDMTAAVARHRLGAGAIIGLSLEHVDEVAAVDPALIDYVAASPVFSTATKADSAPPLGLPGVQALRARTPLPLVGIGGIDATNAAAVIQAGADGIAVVSAILATEDSAAATRALRTAVDGARPRLM